MKAGPLQAGRMVVLISNDPDFSVEGTLNKGGVLSGMASLYHRLGLVEGSVIAFEIANVDTLRIISPENPKSTSGETLVATGDKYGTVFSSQALKHIHIEPFRAANLNDWEPETETDVYLAFGVLQEFTDFEYCCGASASLLSKLGYKSSNETKPDAILISRITSEYMIGEWKKRSSDFKTNHVSADIDVLVCWIDDETEREKLPKMVLCLHDIAREAAEIALQAS